MQPDVMAPPDGTKTPTLRDFLTGPILKWASIVGGAITLFGNLSTIFDLAEWARWLVTNWDKYVVSIWHWIFSQLGIVLPIELAHTLTYLVFVFGLTISSRKPIKLYYVDFNDLISVIFIVLFIVFLPLFAYIFTLYIFGTSLTSLFIYAFVFPILFLWYLHERKIILIIMSTVLFYRTAFPTFILKLFDYSPINSPLVLTVPVFLVWIILATERKALLNRLLFLNLGLGTLIAMNELTLLHGYLKPPAD